MNTLAKIACGISDNLPTRVAAVALKEQKRLLIAPRELPFSAIALENMHKLALLGVIVAPPVMGYYARHDSPEAMERFIIGKWYDALGIENTLYDRSLTAPGRENRASPPDRLPLYIHTSLRIPF